ncbi:MAG: glycerate kinase [Bacteroidota bacterium]
MNVLIASDKFKGSLTANDVCDAVKSGLLKNHPDLNIISIPMADGGEGTCELLTHYFQGNVVSAEVTGPLFENRYAEYGISLDGTTAFIEMAKASGLQLLKPENRNPLYTTTLGTGELIKDALNRGVQKILMGIGGSSTNDAGMGMAQALGVGFYDSQNNVLKPIGENLIHLHSIRTDRIHPRIKEVKFEALCDVDNPLYGIHGAAYTFAPQKGATEKAVKLLDEGLRNFETVIQKTFKTSANFPGAGAGGGLPGMAKVFLNISFHRGMEYLISVTGLEEKIKQADIIITGEGKIDQQTLAGKVVMEIGRLGLKYNKKVVAIAGKCELSTDELRAMGIMKAISLMDSHNSEKEAITNAYHLIQEKAIMVL